jgi:hypothetical protein
MPLARLLHERATDPRIGEWLEKVEGSSLVEDSLAAAVNVRAWRRAYERARAIPERLAGARLPRSPLHSRAVGHAEADFPHSVFPSHVQGDREPLPLVSKSAHWRTPAPHQDEDLGLPSTPSTIPGSAERGIGWT